MQHPSEAAPSSGMRPLTISIYPPRVVNRGNPYFILCHAALEKHGIRAVDDLEIDRRWLEARADQVDAVHLHWPEDIWRKGFGATVGRVGRGVKAGTRLWSLHQFLRTARRLGMQRIWTVHNMEPHEGAYRWDRYGYRLLARETDVIVCHSRATADAVRRDYPPAGRVVVMPIGELGSAYPPARPREEVLAGLGLDPALPVVSCLGRLREYKGLELACAAIERLAGRVQLIVGGPRHAGFDSGPLRAAASRIPGFALIERPLTDPEFAEDRKSTRLNSSHSR